VSENVNILKDHQKYSPGLADVDVVVLAGGLGTRIQPVLGDIPKLLAPINDRTYLDYLFAWLVSFGARRVILSLGHLADRIIAHIEASPFPGLTVETVTENTPLGTAGALRLVRPKIDTEHALVMNGDSWIGADLSSFVDVHRARTSSVTLLCVQVAESGRFGRVNIDGNSNIMAFREKQDDGGPGLINAGVYAFSSAGWDMIDDASGASLERDVFAKQPASTLAAYDAGAVPFIDIGTPESLAKAAQVIGRKSGTTGDA